MFVTLIFVVLALYRMGNSGPIFVSKDDDGYLLQVSSPWGFSVEEEPLEVHNPPYTGPSLSLPSAELRQPGQEETNLSFFFGGIEAVPLCCKNVDKDT